MLVIRLARTGRKNLAQYRIVAADSRRAASGKYVARLGHYNPHTKEAVYNKEELAAYIKKGAQPSSTLVKLLKKDKVSLPKWAEANLIVKKKAPKKKDEAAQETAPAKPAAPTSEDQGSDSAKADVGKGQVTPDSSVEAKADSSAEAKTDGQSAEESKPTKSADKNEEKTA